MAARKNTVLIQIVAGTLVAGLCWTIARGFEEPNVSVGDTAPQFKIVSDDGRTMTRSDFGGKVLVLNFWATWCPPCIEELPSLDAMQRTFAQQGLVVLAVSVDKNEKGYRDFLNQVKLSFSTARDPQADISASYGTFKYPETYVIDSRGKVIAKHISNQNWMDERILREIRALL